MIFRFSFRSSLFIVYQYYTGYWFYFSYFLLYIYSKFETYIHRFCLIIQLCKWVCNEGDKNCIDLDSVLKSIRLVSYFKNTALQICSMIEGVMLTPKQTELLEKLPDKFTRSEGLEVAVSMNWSTSTYDRFLKKATGTYLYHEYGNYKKAQ